MAKLIKVKGYDEFKSAVENNTGKEINAYFTGSKNQNGVSWCPDCVQAEPFVLAAVEKFANSDSVFISVDVGERTYWKDMKNLFRTDKKISISVIPTIIKWDAVKRLEGNQCENPDLLQMFFETDD